jgi:hypothetical protein
MAAASASGGSTTSASKFADDFLFLLDNIQKNANRRRALLTDWHIVKSVK